MNALSITPDVTAALEPLVIDMGRGRYGWVGSGLGFILDARGSGMWHPVTDVESFSGRVLKPSQVVALVAAYGRPL